MLLRTPSQFMQKAEQPISIADMRRAFRFHYDNTEHDPYLHSNPKEPYRPVSIFRTTQTHILQVSSRTSTGYWLCKLCGYGNGRSRLVPSASIKGITSYPEAYTKGTNEASVDSAYWKFRKVMTLGMVNYNKYAPIIRKLT